MAATLPSWVLATSPWSLRRELTRFNLRLYLHRYRIITSQLNEVRKRYTDYGAAWKVDFSDLLDEYSMLRSADAKFVLFSPLTEHEALYEWRKQIHGKLLARLEAVTDDARMMPPDERWLARILAESDYQREQVLRSSQVIGLAIVGSAQFVLENDIEAAYEVLEGIKEEVVRCNSGMSHPRT